MPKLKPDAPRPAEARVVPPQESPPPQLPTVVAAPAPRRRARHLLRLLVFLLVLLGAAGGAGYYWWQQLHPRLPPGIAWGNGRLEADEIDIDTKFAGRIAKMYVDEGDMVKPGQVVAVMDTRDLEATLKKDEALVRQARQAVEEANANLEQQQTQLKLARREFDRTATLVPKGFATVELLDQRRQAVDASIAAVSAATSRIRMAKHLLTAATHDVELYKVNIADNSLVAPKEGPIEYRVANIGEVLPAGGKVFTMLDASYVYMDIYLPTQQAGRVRIGSDARIVLDAYPEHVIPAKVVFIASQAQFTPKTVETKEERDKLMFRIRVRIDPERLEGRAGLVRSGLPGVAYVKTEAHVSWPPDLQSSVLPTPIAVPP